MDFRAFERRARVLWEEIPAEYRAGVDGLTVSRQRMPDPDAPGVFTLGECLTESYPSEWEGPETLRSRLVLYHGSFRALAARDETFDWEEELWETLTHELRHHLESLADEDALEGVDYAADHEFRRYDGRTFDPHYYRSGERLGDGWYAVERTRYREVEWPEDGPVRVSVRGVTYELDPPGGEGDVAYLDVVSGLPEDPDVDVTIVLLRPAPGWRRIVGFLRGTAPRIVEAEVEARPAARTEEERG